MNRFERGETDRARLERSYLELGEQIRAVDEEITRDVVAYSSDDEGFAVMSTIDKVTEGTGGRMYTSVSYDPVTRTFNSYGHFEAAGSELIEGATGTLESPSESDQRLVNNLEDFVRESVFVEVTDVTHVSDEDVQAFLAEVRSRLEIINPQ